MTLTRRQHEGKDGKDGESAQPISPMRAPPRRSESESVAESVDGKENNKATKTKSPKKKKKKKTASASASADEEKLLVSPTSGNKKKKAMKTSSPKAEADPPESAASDDNEDNKGYSQAMADEQEKKKLKKQKQSSDPEAPEAAASPAKKKKKAQAKTKDTNISKNGMRVSASAPMNPEENKKSKNGQTRRRTKSSSNTMERLESNVQSKASMRVSSTPTTTSTSSSSTTAKGSSGKRRRRASRSARDAPAAASAPGAVAVAGINSNENDDDEDVSNDPSSSADTSEEIGRKKRSPSSVELASGGEVDSQSSRRNRRRDREGNDEEDEQQQQGDGGDAAGATVIEAHLVPDEEDVENQIAERVRQEVELTLRQSQVQSAQAQSVVRSPPAQPQLDDQATATVVAIRMDEPNDDGTATGTTKGDDEEMLFGMKRYVAIGSIIGCCACVIIIVVAVVVAMAVAGGKDGNQNLDGSVQQESTIVDESPTGAPTSSAAPTQDWLEMMDVSERFHLLYSLLFPTINPTSVNSFDYFGGGNENSPKFQAMQWMADEDLGNFPFDDDFIPTLLERYALMVLYFSNTITLTNATQLDSTTSTSSDLAGTDVANSRYNGEVVTLLEEIGFRSSQSVCSWYDSTNKIGIECDGPSVYRIWLSDTQLQSTIPTEVGLLSSLQLMDFDDNFLIGTIPTEIANLSRLKTIWMLNNGLEGTIPFQLGEQLQNMLSLDLSKNALVGQIPTSLGMLTDLQDMYLTDNNLSGPIPSEFGNFAEIERLWLFSNALTGTLPSEMQNLQQLTNLGIQHLDITGNLDPILCDVNRINPFLEFYADCQEPNPDVSCSCCTHCCGSTSFDGCDINICPERDAIPIEFNPAGTVVSGSTAGRGATMPEDESCQNTGAGGSSTIWYKVTSMFPTETQRVAVTTCSFGTTFDTVIAVFKGTPDNGGCGYECVDSNDDHGLEANAAAGFCANTYQSFLVFDVEPTETYYIVISGFDVNESGDFSLAMLAS